MDTALFEHHLMSPQGQGRLPAAASTVTTEGGACGDRMRFSLATDGERVIDAGFDAQGCGSATAAGSAAVTLVRGRSLLEAGRIGAASIARELGGLSSSKYHVAELAAEALHRALGDAARTHGAVARAAAGRVLVAMSGGVDSAVAALLSARSQEVVTVTLELWADQEHDGERSCCSASAVSQARSLAHSMRLPHFTVDLRREFKAGVVEPFLTGFSAGDTPNPCIGCNGSVRLDAMLALATRLGCDCLATGHYARVEEAGHPDGPLLRMGADRAKDQSYMLASLSSESLARMRFPLGELTKHQVRHIARDQGLPVASKADSQDLCFLAGTSRARFLARHGGLGERPGKVVNRAGIQLGAHSGQHHFTVGQRRGIGVASREPLYVLEKDADTNRVIVGRRAELARDRVTLRSATLRRDGHRVNSVKLRYRSKPLPARVMGEPAAGDHPALTIELGEAAEGPAPGQLACLLDADVVVGWGTIDRPR